MPEKQKIPFGLWPSPITPAMQGARLRIEDVQFNSDGSLVWLESLSGVSALMHKSGPDAPRDLSGGLKIGGGVGYGGGDFTVRNGLVIFASGGRLHRTELAGGLPRSITPEFGDCASPALSPDGSQVLFVHTYERADCLALARSDGSAWPVKLASGADFYMQPTWHPDGRQIAWIEWNHPQMPWDGTRLMTAQLNGTEISSSRQVYGSPDLPVFQPAYSPDGRWLAFLANDGEWDSLNIIDLASGEKRVLVHNAALLEPAWAQGQRLIAWSPDSARIYYPKNDKGWRSLWAVELSSAETHSLAIAPYTWISQLACSPVSEQLAFLASAPHITSRVVTQENGQTTIQRRSSNEAVPASELPEPRPIEWPAQDGTVIHALYYPPSSTRFTSDGLPPAIVNIHGGPTSAAFSSYNSSAAFFCTRGYSYIEVNYRGSTGYGRSYMLKLREKWGLVDTEDAAGAAGVLAALELADPHRIVIMGGSAGGYTVMNALIHYPGVFKAGVDLFGVASLFDLLVGTHKFEERYNDSLVGPLPEAAERYKAWSPTYHLHQIKDPVAVYQGADDKVVPPEHSEQLVAALRANKIPHIYRLYPGEGHGFRKTENIIDFHETLDKFLQQYVLF